MGNLFFTKEQLKEIDEKEKEKFLSKTNQTSGNNKSDDNDKKWLKNQVENYDILGIFGSIRKVCALLMIVSIIITLIFLGLSIDRPPFMSWLEVIVMSLLTIFVYKGKKWAIITAMILWTLGKGYQLVGMFSSYAENSSGIFLVIFWWIVWMVMFKNAYRVEKARTEQ